MKALIAALVFVTIAHAADRITLLYDENAARPFAGGWGYSAMVEYRGQRILFDAGGNARALTQNCAALAIDLTKLDAVVISHDDPDHYAGLPAVYAVNPRVKTYVPEQDSGAFSVSILNRLWRMLQGALPHQQVVDAPANANYVRLEGDREIAPGARLIMLPFGERREQALELETPGGKALITGCAHPGIAEFIKRSGGHVRIATGGFHLMTSSQNEIRVAVQSMKQAGVESVYPAHCTGRVAIDELRRVFGARCQTIAVGGVIKLGGQFSK